MKKIGLSASLEQQRGDGVWPVDRNIEDQPDQQQIQQKDRFGVGKTSQVPWQDLRPLIQPRFLRSIQQDALENRLRDVIQALFYQNQEKIAASWLAFCQLKLPMASDVENDAWHAEAVSQVFVLHRVAENLLQDENPEKLMDAVLMKENCEFLAQLLHEKVFTAANCWQWFLNQHLFPKKLEVLDLLCNADKTVINLCNDQGHSLLHLAAAFGKKEVVVWLLNQADVDWKIVDGNNQRPLEHAVAKKQDEIADILRAKQNTMQ